MLENFIMRVWSAQHFWKDLFQLCFSWKQGPSIPIFFLQDQGSISILTLWLLLLKTETQEVCVGRDPLWVLTSPSSEWARWPPGRGHVPPPHLNPNPVPGRQGCSLECSVWETGSWKWFQGHFPQEPPRPEKSDTSGFSCIWTQPRELQMSECLCISPKSCWSTESSFYHHRQKKRQLRTWFKVVYHRARLWESVFFCPSKERDYEWGTPLR